MRVLHLDASSRFQRSHTRRLSALFVEALRAGDDEIEVVRRDLATDPLPHLNESWIEAAFTKPERRTAAMREALRLSDELVDELLACDICVAGVPMYNFSVPSSFKSWIDHVVRVGRTFSFDPDDAEQPYRGLAGGRKLVVLTSRGDAGYEAGGRYESLNHLDPLIRAVGGLIGITEVISISVEYDEFGGTSMKDSIRRAEERVRTAAAELLRDAPMLCARV